MNADLDVKNIQWFGDTLGSADFYANWDSKLDKVSVLRSLLTFVVRKPFWLISTKAVLTKRLPNFVIPKRFEFPPEEYSRISSPAQLAS